MRIVLYKVNPTSRDTYLGFTEQDYVSLNSDIIHFLGHDYKVVHIEQGSYLNTVWVKLVN